jgi:acetyltransferase-like isoleucine patch superfamily enzyme
VPAPRVVTIPLRLLYTGVRDIWNTAFRLLIAEPIFKSYCAQVGRRFRAGAFVHWVQGSGRIIIGEDVLIDGKCSFAFAARYSDAPLLRIGDRTGIGHACVFVVGREISIGADCRIAGGASFREAPGHPLDPEARRRGEAAPPEVIKPIVIDDNVWIGSNAIVHGGVHIGAGSVISSGAVVMTDVPAGSLIAGNPGRRIGVVAPAAAAAPSPEQNQP